MQIMGAGKPATIYDVAARAGVSKSLVSLVLQRSPRVSQQRRDAVLKAIQELDYRPSTAAVSLAGPVPGPSAWCSTTSGTSGSSTC